MQLVGVDPDGLAVVAERAAELERLVIERSAEVAELVDSVGRVIAADGQGS